MLNIALPSSGPLYQSTIDFLNDAGIPIKRTSERAYTCLLYTTPSQRDATRSRMPSSA